MSDQFRPYARRLLRYKWQVALALFFAAISASGLGAGLVGVKPIVDIILNDRAPDGSRTAPKGLPELAVMLNQKLANTGWPLHISDQFIQALPKGPFNAVLWIVIGLGVLAVIGATCNFLHAYISLTIISRTIANLRRECFHQVIHLPLKTVLGSGPSDLVSRIVYDTSTLAAGLQALLSRAVAQATKAIAAVITAFFFDWKLAAAALLVAPIAVTVIRKLGKRIRRASKVALQGQSNLYRAASEVLGGLRVVKVHANERVEEARFHAINKHVITQEFRVRTARALSSPLIELSAIFVLGALALIAVKAILDGALDRANSLMVLGSLSVAAAQLKPLTSFINDVQQASAAGGRISQLLGLAAEPGHDLRLPRLPRHQDTVRFENIHFTYPGAETPAVAGVSLTIPYGKTVAFVGPNGCGKTTLLSLIPRLFDPDRGSILIDGNDVRAFSIRSLRGQIGVVPQETVLFKGSIADNISYGAENATPERVAAAARAARAEEFILAKPGGYAYEIAEGGSGLSGGQRQRIAIARAILRDSAILILDEATSMIDAESEARISEAIGEFVGKSGRTGTSPRTCLIVAHRLSTVVAVDSIVVMDQGRVVDQGTHDELLGRCEIYQSLTRHQLIRGATA